MKISLRKKSIFFLLLMSLFVFLPLYADDDGGDSDSTESSDDEFDDGVFGKKDYDGGGGLDELTAAYESARAEVEAVLEGERDADPIEFDQMVEAMEEAKSALDDYCDDHGYHYTEDDYNGAITVYDAEDNIVYSVGDPVMLANGVFRLSDCDLSIRVGKTEFSVARQYESQTRPLEFPDDGAFGSVWKSIFDSRIILGTLELAEAESTKWNNLLFSAQCAVDNINEYVNLNSDCERFKKVAEEILSQRLSQKNQYEALAEKSKARSQKNVYTRYGYAGQLSRNLGVSSLIFVDDHGNPIVFEETDFVGVYRNERYADKLSLKYNLAQNCYNVTYKTGETRLYDEYGLLQSISFPDGGVIRFSYNAAHKVESVTVNGLRSISFTWSFRHITSAFDGLKKITYTYKDNLLVSVEDEEGDKKSYAYNSSDRLISQIKPDGSAIRFGYLSHQDGRVRTSYTMNENGAQETFSYDIAHRRTTYTDHDGVKSVYEYDINNRTTKEIYADGTIISYGYDGNGHLSWREVNGNRESYTYDSDGHLTAVLFSDGSSMQQVYSGNKLISYTDRDGVTTSFDYDSRGNNTAVWRGGQKVWGYTYNEMNLVTQTTDCRGNRVEFVYDRMGNLLQKKMFSPASGQSSAQTSVLASGQVSVSTESWKYDAFGRVTEHTLPSGTVQTYRYEPHAVFCSESNGFETEVRYSNRKDLIYKRQKDTVTGEERIYRYEYDKCHNCIRMLVSGTDGSGKKYAEIPVQSNTYTGHGRLSKNIIWNTEESGWGTENEYDKAGNIIRKNFGEIGRDDNFSAISHAVTFQTQRTSDGLETTETNADGRIFLRRYDPWNRLTELRAGEMIRKKNCFSPGGRLVQSLLPTGGELEYVYDKTTGFFAGSQEIGGTVGMETITCYADGKKSVVTNPLGAKTYYYYDAFGNVCRLVADGKTEAWEYDSANRLIKHVISASDGAVVAEETFAYSTDGRTVTHMKGGRYKTVYRRNAFGEIISVQDAAGNTERFIYDVRGRCSEKYDAYGRKTQYFYDGKNRLVQKTRCNGAVTTYAYDSEGNCIKISDDSGVIFTADYDKSGRVVSRKQNPSATTEQYEYDDKDRFISILRGGKAILRTEFDDSSKSFVRIDAKGNRSIYTTDGFGRILKEKNRLGVTQQHQYAADGALAVTTDYAGQQSTCAYARADNKLTVAYADGSFSEEMCDAAGAILSARTNVSHLRFTYDAAGHLLTQQDVVSGETVRYTYDDCGRRIRLQSAKQDITYQYGKCGELTKIADRISGICLQFVYDEVGNEILRVHSTGESVQSIYDKSDRLLLTAAYNSYSNLISAEGTVYGKNGERVLSLNGDFTVTRYRYDDNGRLCSVQYPYTEELAGYLKKLCAESGAGAGKKTDAVSGILSLTTDEYDALKSLCAKVSAGMYQPQINVLMLEERFAYDENGNISRRETPFGTIAYEYDADDRLVAWGNAGSARYDANGNLLQKKNLYKCENYVYTVHNRMKSVVVQDLLSSEICTTTCRYDAFGRRTETDSSRSGTLTTVYDGLTFNDLYAVRSAGTASVEGQNPNVRYQYIDDQTSAGRTRTISSRTENENPLAYADYFPTDTGYTVLYGNSRTPVALSMLGTNSAERYALFSDAIGTVKATSKSDGTQSNFLYDAFGAQLSSARTTAAAQLYGFAGKKSLDITSLYDFGFRDYSPLASRFTTSDPARDGTNWYTYCGGDPVNYVDLLGLENLRPNDVDMHDSRWANEKLGDVYTDIFLQLSCYSNEGKNGLSPEEFGSMLNSMGYETLATAGCVVAGLAEIINVLTGSNLTPKDINDMKSNFAQGKDLIDYTAVGKNYDLAHDYWTKEVQGDLSNKIDELNKSSTQYAILAEVYYSQGHTHWVGIDGGVVVRDDGKNYVAISATSINDKTLAGGRSSVGWIKEDDKIYVPTEDVKTLQQYSNPNAVSNSGKEDASASKNQ